MAHVSGTNIFRPQEPIVQTFQDIRQIQGGQVRFPVDIVSKHFQIKMDTGLMKGFLECAGKR